VYSSASLSGPWEPRVDLLRGIGGMNMSQVRRLLLVMLLSCGCCCC